MAMRRSISIAICSLAMGAATAMVLAWWLASRAYWFEEQSPWIRAAPAGYRAGAAADSGPLAGVEAHPYRAPGVVVSDVLIFPADRADEFARRHASFERGDLRRGNASPDPSAHAAISPPEAPWFVQRLIAPWEHGGTWALPPMRPWQSVRIVVAGWPWPAAWALVSDRLARDSGWRDGAYIVTSGRGWVLPPMAAIQPKVIPARPIWTGLLPAAVLFAPPWFALISLPWWLLAWIRARRRGRGLCVRCRYDRRGLADQAPCPECGRPADAGA